MASLDSLSTRSHTPASHTLYSAYDRLDTPDLLRPSPSRSATPSITVSPPKADVQPSAVGADETERQLAAMRAKWGAHVQDQNRLVRVTSDESASGPAEADEKGGVAKMGWSAAAAEGVSPRRVRARGLSLGALPPAYEMKEK